MLWIKGPKTSAWTQKDEAIASMHNLLLWIYNKLKSDRTDNMAKAGGCLSSLFYIILFLYNVSSIKKS